MPRLSEIVADEREVTIHAGEVPFSVWYRPSAVTMPMLVRAAKLQDIADDQALEEISALLCDFIAGWDITGDDDEPLPVDATSLDILPAKLIVAIMQTITADIEPEEEEKKGLNGNSAVGSSRKAKQANARSGSPLSRRQSSME